MFKSAPEIVNHEITFELNEKNLQQWMEQISIPQPSASIKAIFHLVQTINGLSIAPEKKLRLLELLEVRVTIINDVMKDSYLENNFPLGKQQYSNVEMLVWLYYELACGYAEVGEQSTGIIKKKQKALSFFLALKCLNRLFIIICEVYCRPFEGFWHFCYRLYEKSEHEKLLDLNIPNQEHTISEMFSHILVLQLCSTDQIRNRQIGMVSSTLFKYLDYVKINREIDLKYVESYCAFDLYSDKPPFRMLKNGYKYDPSKRYISCVIIAKKIYRDLQKDINFQKEADANKLKLIKRVVNNLGMAQRRKNSRFNMELDCFGFLGYRHIVNHLYIEKKQNLGHLNLASRIQSTEVFFENENIPEDIDINSSDIKILDSSSQGRKIFCKSDQINIKIGEVVGISPDFTGRIESGLVCRLDNHYNENVTLGVKILSLETKFALMSHPSKKSLVIKVLYLPGTRSIQAQDCVIFCSKQFQPGDVVILNVEGRKIIGHLGQTLNQTSAIKHTIFIPARKSRV